MATVYKSGTQWIAQWYRPGGHRVKRATGHRGAKREAKRIAERMEADDRAATTTHGRAYHDLLARATADATAGRLTAERAADYLLELQRIADPSFHIVTLSGYLATWLAAKTARVRPKTAAVYADTVRRFGAAFPAAVWDAPLPDLTRQHIEAALRELQKTGLRAATINLDLSALRQALRQAAADGLIPRNPAGSIPSLAASDSTERAPFTAAEVRQLLDAPTTPHEWRGIILFGAHTGLRLGDIARLSASQIHGTDVVLRPEKTSRSRKTVRIPLTPPLLALVRGKSGPFFPEAAATKIATLSTRFARLMARAGVPADVTLPGGIPARRSFHSLRHSFSTWLAEADVHADVRRKLTGHTSAAVHDGYTHHHDALTRAVATLPTLTSA